MCGRYSITTPLEAIIQLFKVAERPNLRPRYNVAPTQMVPAVRLGDDGNRHLVELRWGLIPGWAKDSKIGYRMINARAETVREKPAFRSAFGRRRCLLAADGFYEWQKTGNGKQPYRLCMDDGGPFAFAGLWEFWEGTGDEPAIESCSILTTDANDVAARVHNRMPVILDEADFDAWLDGPAEAAAGLMRPYSGSRTMIAYPVDSRVGNVRNDDSALIEPLSEVDQDEPSDPDGQQSLL